MQPHLLTNFELEMYYQNEPRFNGVFSRNNLPKKIKDGAYTINLDEYSDVGTHWIALFCNKNEIVYCDSFSVKHIPEEINEFIDHPSSSASQNKNIKANIFSSTSKRFSNVWVLLHRIYLFYASRSKIY